MEGGGGCGWWRVVKRGGGWVLAAEGGGRWWREGCRTRVTARVKVGVGVRVTVRVRVGVTSTSRRRCRREVAASLLSLWHTGGGARLCAPRADGTRSGIGCSAAARAVRQAARRNIRMDSTCERALIKIGNGFLENRTRPANKRLFRRVPLYLRVSSSFRKFFQ